MKIKKVLTCEECKKDFVIEINENSQHKKNYKYGRRRRKFCDECKAEREEAWENIDKIKFEYCE